MNIWCILIRKVIARLYKREGLNKKLRIYVALIGLEEGAATTGILAKFPELDRGLELTLAEGMLLTTDTLTPPGTEAEPFTTLSQDKAVGTRTVEAAKEDAGMLALANRFAASEIWVSE
jgi:hypothetical protein